MINHDTNLIMLMMIDDKYCWISWTMMINEGKRWKFSQSSAVNYMFRWTLGTGIHVPCSPQPRVVVCHTSPWKVAEALSTSKEQSLKNRNKIFKEPLVTGGKPKGWLAEKAMLIVCWLFWEWITTIVVTIVLMEGEKCWSSRNIIHESMLLNQLAGLIHTYSQPWNALNIWLQIVASQPGHQKHPKTPTVWWVPGCLRKWSTNGEFSIYVICINHLLGRFGFKNLWFCDTVYAWRWWTSIYHLVFVHSSILLRWFSAWNAHV